MKDFLLRLKEKFTQPEPVEDNPADYVELGSTGNKEERAKILVRPFVMEEFEDIKEVLDSLREGSTIALINIKPLKDKDLVELKRAINKLRKTCEAIEGDVAGFGEDYVVAVPYVARIHRSGQSVTMQAAPEA
ncbi:cell division protein SepF [Candidatus Woesearchaeota archaeon]|nr:cell division protein SepF [Candidatus Woesearchaeota archaeon]